MHKNPSIFRQSAQTLPTWLISTLADLEDASMFYLIENGEIYAPEKLGTRSILLGPGGIIKVGAIDGAKLAGSGLECQVIDAAGCYVLPGFIDPHQHIAGAGGEEGFATRTPEVPLTQITQNGITTVVGLLGTDGTTRNLTTLLGKARELDEGGVSTYIYTGSFRVPPTLITNGVVEDMVLIDKVIGVGEIAISDARGTEPTVHELARLVSEAMLGGMVSGKAGVVHFHTGPGKDLLGILHKLLDETEIPPKYLYPTHTNRTRELLDDAILLAKRGSYVDIDTTEPGLGKWLLYYMENGGPATRLTVSSDAHALDGNLNTYDEFKKSVHDYKLALESILPFFTRNTADALKLEKKGRLQEGADADLLLVDKRSLEIKHLFARGQQMVRAGEPIVKGKFE
jgi:beta-aspartyl-dipeptidase (metallo-type)